MDFSLGLILGIVVTLYLVIGFINLLHYGFNQGFFGHVSFQDGFVKLMAWPICWLK